MGTGLQAALSQGSRLKSILFCQGPEGVLGGCGAAREGGPFYKGIASSVTTIARAT